MLKVFGFVSRHPRLTHDEYRAAHVGYHNSFGRRLNNIRGYLLNVRSNRNMYTDFSKSAMLRSISFGEPESFDEKWDGYGQLNFDDIQDYLGARSAALDRPGPSGLELDQLVGKVGDDFRYLYRGSPFQFCVDESIKLPVIRLERKMFKVVQFIKAPTDLSAILFRSYLTGRYCSALSMMSNLKGLVLNLRTSLDVMTGFFAPDSEAFTEAGKERRNSFYRNWDGMIEYWFEHPDAFFSNRFDERISSHLNGMENELFISSFFREVDETVAVMPNRNPAPDFYHR